ncbi:MAG: hypothetical protein V1914_01775 [archaeon]
MDKQVITKLTRTFEDYAHKDGGVEFWFARDLQKLLGYVEWRKFLGAIERAKESCKNAGQAITDHFVGAAKTIGMPKGATKEVDDSNLRSYSLGSR